MVESTLIQSFANFNNGHSTLTIENLAAQTILKANTNILPPDWFPIIFFPFCSLLGYAFLCSSIYWRLTWRLIHFFFNVITSSVGFKGFFFSLAGFGVAFGSSCIFVFCSFLYYKSCVIDYDLFLVFRRQSWHLVLHFNLFSIPL